MQKGPEMSICWANQFSFNMNAYDFLLGGLKERVKVNDTQWFLYKSLIIKQRKDSYKCWNVLSYSIKWPTVSTEIILNAFFFFPSLTGDITQKGYEKKRSKLIGAYLPQPPSTYNLNSINCLVLKVNSHIWKRLFSHSGICLKSAHLTPAFSTACFLV